jgi:hypothetical protein
VWILSWGDGCGGALRRAGLGKVIACVRGDFECNGTVNKHFRCIMGAFDAA